MAVPQDDDKMPDIVKDYVCVVDVGLFELSLRMEDKANCVSSIDILSGYKSTSSVIDNF